MSSTVYSILKELSSTNSVKEKELILREHKQNQILANVIYHALSPRVKFYIKKIPPYDTMKQVTLNLTEALTALNSISSRYYTGNAAIDWLRGILEQVDFEDCYIIERIIEKDLKCGINSSTVNKVWPKLIEETPYMGAITFSGRKARKLFTDGGPIYSQVKMDGRYVNVLVNENGTPMLESRSGEITFINTFDDVFPTTPNGFVLNGELTIDGMPRYDSNGIIASLVSINKKRMLNEDVSKKEQQFKEEWQITCKEAESSIRLTVWDMITLEEYSAGASNSRYSDRLRNAAEIIRNVPSVRLIESKFVYSLDEAMKHWRELVARGEEGTIIKDPSCPWKDGKPNLQMKIKLAFEVDLRIIGFKPGKSGTRLENTLGALICESKEGLVQTDPSGMNDLLRNKIWSNRSFYLNSIVEVTCSGLSTTDSGFSLLHPRVSELRPDKLNANTLKEIQTIQASIQEIR
jgi:hypothetical protein